MKNKKKKFLCEIVNLMAIIVNRKFFFFKDERGFITTRVNFYEKLKKKNFR